MPIRTAIPSLAGTPWLQRAETQRVLRALASAGHDARIVGGAVRNALLGEAVADIDIATPATPEMVTRAAAAAGLHVIPTGLQHGTVTIVADHQPYEVTTLRRDVETDGRHATVAFTQDWAADAARRDFTINALYCDAAGTVHDPLGGHPDLVARRVRFIGSADQRIAEDYLRILRFFRFHAQYGRGPLDAEGLDACVRGGQGLARLSAERVRAELLKLLVAPAAGSALDAMAAHGLLSAVTGATPRLDALARLVTIEQGHGVTPSAIRRLGCLCLQTTQDAGKLVDRLRLTNDERAILEYVTGPLAAQLHAGLDERAARALLYRMGATAWREAVLVQWAWAAAPAAGAGWPALLALPTRWPVPALPIKGGDLVALGLTAGPRVGALLRELEDAWIAADFAWDRATMLAEARTSISSG